MSRRVSPRPRRMSSPTGPGNWSASTASSSAGCMEPRPGLADPRDRHLQQLRLGRSRRLPARRTDRRAYLRTRPARCQRAPTGRLATHARAHRQWERVRPPGRISKAGASQARHVLGEVAWKVTLTPGPLRAFFERVRARRGPQIAATATARKLVVLFWHLLAREQDYAFGRPAMTRNKIRRLELLAGAPSQKGRKGVGGGKSKAVFDAERALSHQAEAAYQRLVTDWKATRPATAGAGATPGRASQRPSKGKAARQTP